jgi:uncharacterized membrane protein
MTNQETKSTTLHRILWVAQGLLAVIFIMGAVMKFMPIEKIAPIMPWTGELPALIVRLLGLVDLSAALGLILPSLLRIQPALRPWAALYALALLICATVFPLLRGEASVIGFNLFVIVLAGFIAWGRFKKVPIAAK